MARPFQIDAPLTSFVQMSMQDMGGFLSARPVLPIVGTNKLSFEYHKFNVKGLAPMTALDLRRERGSTFERFQTTSSTQTGLCLEYGVEVPRDLITLQNADLDLAEADAMSAAIQVVGAKEERLVTLMETDANFGTAADASTLSGQWSDDSSNPKQDINTAKRTIRTATNNSPGLYYAIINEAVFHRLQLHPLVRDQFKFTTSEFPAEAILARYLGLDALFVGVAVEDTAAMGQDASLGNQWSDSCAVYKVPPGNAGNGFNDCFAKQFNVNFALGGERANGISIERYADPTRRSQVVRASDIWLYQSVNTAAGYRIKDCLA